MKIKELAIRFQNILKYSACSLSATALDVTIVFVLKHWIPLVAANTISIICGTIFHYLLTSRLVFRVKIHRRSLRIYFGTFFLNLLIANSLIVLFVHATQNTVLPDVLQFLLSKLCSALIPFFFTYFLRKFLFAKFPDQSPQEGPWT